MSWFSIVKARPSNIDRLDKLFERWKNNQLSDEEYEKEYLELSEKLKRSERTTSMSNRALRYGGRDPISSYYAREESMDEIRPKKYQTEQHFPKAKN